MVYTGKDQEIFWGRETSGFGQGDNTSDTHQPFNPIEAIIIPRAEYTIEEIRTADSLVPNIVHTALKEVGKCELATIYKDPFLGLCAFPEKSLTGDFASAAYSTIAAGFSTDDHIDSIWLYSQLKDKDGSAHLDKFLTGIKLTKRVLVAEATDRVNKLIREIIGLAAADLTDMDGSEDTFDHDANFDDNKWASWDSVRKTKDVVLSWNSNEINHTNYGFKWTKCEFGFDIPHKLKHEATSLVAQDEYMEELNPFCRLAGYITGDTIIDEIEKDMDSRTTATLQFKFDSTASENKYDQFTNAYLHSIEGLPKYPKHNEIYEAVLLFKGDDPVYSLSYSYADDDYAAPGDRLNS